MRSLGASKVPPTFGFDDIQSCIEMHRVPDCYTKIVGDLRIPAQDAMCASHRFFRGFGVTEVLSQSGRKIECLKLVNLASVEISTDG